MQKRRQDLLDDIDLLLDDLCREWGQSPRPLLIYSLTGSF